MLFVTLCDTASMDHKVTHDAVIRHHVMLLITLCDTAAMDHNITHCAVLPRVTTYTNTSNIMFHNNNNSNEQYIMQAIDRELTMELPVIR